MDIHMVHTNYRFIPDVKILFSCCLVARKDMVSLIKNDFLCFSPLSTLIKLPHHHFS
jgi:hypothetical protein